MRTKIILLFIISLSLITTKTNAQTESEPNNTFSTANTLTFTNNTVDVQGSIGIVGDQDYYKVVIPQGGVLDVEIANVPTGINMVVEIFAQNTALLASTNTNSGTLLSQLVCGANSTFFIRLRDSGNNDFSNDLYDLTVSLDIEDPYECNNSFSDATDLQLGQTISAKIKDVGDEDFYKVIIPQGGVLDVEIANVPTGINMVVEIFAQNTALLASTNTTSGTLLSQLVCGANSTFFIRLRDSGNNDFSNDLYDLTVSLDIEDPYECNNSFSDATDLQLGQTISAKIKDVGDEDFYKVIIPQGGVLDVEIANVPIGINMIVEIFAQNTALLASTNTNSGTLLSQLVCGENNTFFVRLRDSGNNDFSNDLYNLTVSLDIEDPYECNNSFSDATDLQLGQTISAKIKDVGDEDYYKVVIPQGGVLDVDIANVPTGINMIVEIFAQNTALLASTNTNSGTLLSQLVCGENNTFFIRLRDSGNNDSSNDLYDLTVSLDTNDPFECNNSFADATLIDTCETILGAINNTGDNDYYVFNAVANVVVEISLTDVPADIEPAVSVFNSNTSTITNQSASSGNDLIFTFTPATTGQHFLRISDSGNNDSNSDLYTLFLSINGCEPLTNQAFSLKNSAIIYPNPFQNTLNIDLQNGISVENLSIFNIYGKKVFETNTLEKNLNLESLQNGIYILRLETATETAAFKIIKE